MEANYLFSTTIDKDNANKKLLRKINLSASLNGLMVKRCVPSHLELFKLEKGDFYDLLNLGLQ